MEHEHKIRVYQQSQKILKNSVAFTGILLVLLGHYRQHPQGCCFFVGNGLLCYKSQKNNTYNNSNHYYSYNSKLYVLRDFSDITTQQETIELKHTQDVIYTATNSWLARTIKDARASIEFSDKENGKIIGI